MKIKEVILTQIELINNFILELDRISIEMGKENVNEDYILDLYLNLLKKYPGNPVILKKFAEFLQLISSKSLYTQYKLDDVSNLYENLTRLNPSDIDQELEHYYFMYNVMDEVSKAKSILMKIKNQMKQISDAENWPDAVSDS
ncbi:MAG: hypothetical protein WAU21_04495 [Chitinophagales bacterium]|nr:hypothetical protein [Bacteroidota bacterium]MBK8488157.1 hypothetical protein [Bacteroidota bacterium]MBK8682075.1 hypothetical protein [Bacteroidota bacterium]MBP7540807.1 hypothetical protein [Saprospiraceae bacterium]MBP9189619.1 hypothetical protein [Chitinophagales bacterium]